MLIRLRHTPRESWRRFTTSVRGVQHRVRSTDNYARNFMKDQRNGLFVANTALALKATRVSRSEMAAVIQSGIAI
ncbi:hypothetical protein EXIGLDRAFT_737235, partial [Exidia glandulosa HHB12029]